MNLISRAEAKQAGHARYFTGVPCNRGHIAERFVSSRHCVLCACSAASQWKKDNRQQTTDASRAWRAAHRDEVNAAKRAWNAAHPEGQKARSRQWYLANKDKANLQHRTWARRNPEKVRALTNEWWQANPGKATAVAAKRRAALLMRTPAWSDFKAIDEIYRDAAEFRSAGLDVDVDHIIPLQGDLVSGLHVPANLRVFLSSNNRSKSNSFHL